MLIRFSFRTVTANQNERRMNQLSKTRHCSALSDDDMEWFELLRHFKFYSPRTSLEPRTTRLSSLLQLTLTSFLLLFPPTTTTHHNHSLPTVVINHIIIMSAPVGTTTGAPAADKGDYLDQAVSMVTKKGGHATVRSSLFLKFGAFCADILRLLEPQYDREDLGYHS